jgi:hypothetical protein
VPILRRLTDPAPAASKHQGTAAAAATEYNTCPQYAYPFLVTIDGANRYTYNLQAPGPHATIVIHVSDEVRGQQLLAVLNCNNLNMFATSKRTSCAARTFWLQKWRISGLTSTTVTAATTSTSGQSLIRVPNLSFCNVLPASVHCDIHIFEWLVHYLQDPASPPKLDTSNVVSILISSQFLKIERLVDICIL